MKRILSLALIAAVLGACNGKQATPTTTNAGGPGGQSVSGPLKDNVGDLEQAVMIDAKIAQQSEAPNIKATPLVDAMGHMNLLTVDVSPPFPKELWLTIGVKSRRDFAKNPGALRISIKDGDHVLGTFGTVIGKSVKPSVTEHTVNVLAARDYIPETMLVTLDVEALLMPEGTDPETVDPMTAEVPESRFSRAVATPPLRINFIEAAAPPAENVANTAKASAPAERADATAGGNP